MEREISLSQTFRKIFEGIDSFRKGNIIFADFFGIFGEMARFGLFGRFSKNFFAGKRSLSQNFRGNEQISQGENIIFAQFSEKLRDFAYLAVSPSTFRREEITFAEFSQIFRGSGQNSRARNHFRRIFAKFSQKWLDLSVSPTNFRKEMIIFAGVE